MHQGLPPAPPAREADVADVHHGVEVRDPYRWLEDPAAPETQAWVHKQNARTAAYFAPIDDRVEAYRKRLAEVADYPRLGVPARRAGWLYYTRNSGLQDQAVLVRAREYGVREEVVFDPNAHASDGTVALGSWAVSDDGRYFAFLTSAKGSDWNTGRVMELETKRILDDQLDWIKFSGLAWLPDGSGFIYTRYPEPADKARQFAAENRGQRICFHRVGTPQSADSVLYERPDDPDMSFGMSVTEDGKYALLTHYRAGRRGNDVWIAPLPAVPPPREDFRQVLPLGDDRFDVLANDGPILYVKTNCAADRGRIVAVDSRDPAPEKWRTVVPERPEELQSALVVGDFIAAEYLDGAASTLRTYRLDGTDLGQGDLPLGSIYSLAGRRNDAEIHFGLHGFTMPARVLRVVPGKPPETLWQPDVPGWNPDDYATHRLHFPSKDGTVFPVFVTHRKDLALDGNRPTLLYGYGGFHVGMTPSWKSELIPWLEQGGVYAVAVTRGGGEFGRAWYEAGTKERKQNVFDDFFAAAEGLIAAGYTRPQRLAIEGRSNGGLLMGAALTQRPGLFRAVLCHVGVLDMLRYHKFTIGYFWAPDYGTADNPAEFSTLLRYSPLHNIRAGTAYPATLITTGSFDDRVVPAHSYKFAAALQKAQSGPAPILLRVDTKAGHGAGKPLARLLEERAEMWAFLEKELGAGEK